MADENENQDLSNIIKDYLFDDDNIIQIPQLEFYHENKERSDYYVCCKFPFLNIQCDSKVFSTREEAENEINKSRWYKRIFMYVREFKLM